MNHHSKIIRVLLTIFVLLFIATGAEAKTKRHVKVHIMNNTGHRILSATFVHKYSDVYKEEHTWKDLKDGKNSSHKKVYYNTGIFTTGRDWWFVSWVDDTGKAYLSHPDNMRDVMDVLEKAGMAVSAVLVDSGIMLLIADPELIGKAIGAAELVTGAIGLAMYNSEGTSGFKQHILRGEDEGHAVTIHLYKHHIRIVSKSGTSKTGVESCKAKKDKMCDN